MLFAVYTSFISAASFIPVQHIAARDTIFIHVVAGTTAQVRVFRFSQKTSCCFLPLCGSLSPTHSLRLSLPPHPLSFRTTTESACSFVTTEWSHANVRAQSAAYILYIVVVCLFLSFCINIPFSLSYTHTDGRKGFSFVRFSFCTQRVFANLTVNGSAHSCPQWPKNLLNTLTKNRFYYFSRSRKDVLRIVY